TVRLHLVAPVVGPAHRPAQEPELVGQVGGAVVGSGLEQHDTATRVLRESGRQDAARRATADDDRVVGVAHWSSGGGSSHVDVTRMWAPRYAKQSSTMLNASHCSPRAHVPTPGRSSIKGPGQVTRWLVTDMTGSLERGARAWRPAVCSVPVTRN